MSRAPQAVVVEMGFIRSLWSRAPSVLLPHEVFTKGKESTEQHSSRRQEARSLHPLCTQGTESGFHDPSNPTASESVTVVCRDLTTLTPPQISETVTDSR